MPFAPHPDPKKYCAHCRSRLTRKRYGNRLEDMGVFNRRKYCDQICMAAHHAKKEPQTKGGYLWRARRHRKPQCEECPATSQLHVHHADLDWTNNDPSNLVTLCASCHLKLHWRIDGRRERQATTRRVPIDAIAALEGFGDEYGPTLDPEAAASLLDIIRLFR